MGRAALVLLFAFSVAAAPAAAATKRAVAAPRTKQRPARSAARPARPPTLVEAKASMAALMRDPAKRRYRHQWEKGIRGLLRAARGKDAAPAHLEAARARYALYRWSANEADREAALVEARKSERLGSKDAAALARAIRKEAGEAEERPAPARRRAAAPPAPAVAAKPPPAPEPAGKSEAADEDSAPDPALEAALADLSPAASASHPLGSSGGEGPARVSEVRTWSSDDYTRVAVYLSHWVGFQKLELPAAPGRPRRIALDLRPAVLEGAALARPVAGDQVDRVRAAQNDPETVRVVLELPGGDGVHLFALDDPPRLVLDVGSRARPEKAPVAAGEATPEGGKTSDTTSATASTSTTTSTTATTSPAAETGPVAGGTGDEAGEEPAGPVRRIVVDAGHGGHDPGAIGPRRVREKDVTLAMARRLAKKLRDAGFEVVLTRKDDRFLALEERTAIANTARGDLFVSIHANAHPRRTRGGVETYFLNTDSDRYAARLAARENGLDVGDGEADVARILTDLGAKASAGASRTLARMVQREVTGGVRAHIGEVRDLGVKSALFYVLLGARMPAVLVETAFISNRDEERRLASTAYQEEVAAGIARAVSAFARNGDRVAAR
jgi:N-acetylmuramoyl-L-alanine amidase